MTGGSKHGPAAADALRERLEPLAAESREALQRFRESQNELDEGDRPSVNVIVQASPAGPPSRRAGSLIPHGPRGWVAAILLLLASLAGLVKSIADAIK